MKALVVLLAAVGCGLLVMWFWREQMKGRVEPMPPLVEQLERLVEAGALGGQSPESLVATLVFSEPFREADPWDLAPRRKGGMSSMFGEPRELAFTTALLREPRTAAWRLASSDAAAQAAAEAEMLAAARWAAEKGARLRVVAHGASLIPVLRAALAAPQADPPVVERVLGVGVRLADVKAREPALAEALVARRPAAQWLNVFSEPSVVPRLLELEEVDLGGMAAVRELAWPGSSWVPTVVGLAQRGAPQAAREVPAEAPGSQLSVRQFRAVKDGTMTGRVVDGKGHLVSGSLIVPKLGKEEIPPDPEAAENKVGDVEAASTAGGGGELVPLGETGWSIRRQPGFKGLEGAKVACVGRRVLVQEASHWIGLSCYRRPATSQDAPEDFCRGRPKNLVRFQLKGKPVAICKETPPSAQFADGNWQDLFEAKAGEFVIQLEYSYPPKGRARKLDVYMSAIDALVPPK